jgi:RNA polymerase sigma-70 factor (ECF subfamily)
VGLVHDSELDRLKEAEAAAAAESREQVLSRARPKLEALARRLVWDGEEARDLVQSAFGHPHPGWPTNQFRVEAEAWLRRLVVNRALTHLRRRKLWQSLSSLVGFEPTEPASTEDLVEKRQHLARLAAGLSRLSVKQSTIFSLRYLEGLSLDEVADALEMNRGTVRVHLQRAVRRLAEWGLLGAEGEKS